MKIEISAVIFIDEKIMTGICFPEHEIDNEFPHMTLGLSGWQAVMSNNVI